MSPRDIALIMLMNAIWGFATVAAAQSLNHFPPIEFTWFRFMLISLLLAPLLRWHPGQMGQVVLIALTAGTFNFILFFSGLALAGEVGPVAIAGQLGVPFATILSIVLLGEVVRWRRWSGIALAFAGVTIIGFDPRAAKYLDGFLLVVASAFVGSFSSIIMRQVKGIPVFQMMAWIATISWPLLMLMSLAFETDQLKAVRTAEWIHWQGVLYTALMSSLIAHALNYWLLQRFEVSKLAPLTLMAPLFTVLFGVILLGETLTWRFVLGAAITLAGCAIISLREPHTAAIVPRPERH